MTDHPLAPPALSGDDFVRLEVLRGVAALVVVFNHARGWLWAGGGYVRSHGLSADYGPLEWALFALNLLTRCGHEAVIVFFLLSGFSIAHSLRPRPGREAPLMGFYKRRLIRLYPLYLGGLLWASAVALIVMALPGDPALPVRRGAHRLLSLEAEDWFASLAYLPSLPFVPQYWSLIHEVVFYGLAPFLLRRARGYVGVSLLLGVIGIATLGRVVPESIPADFLLRYNLFFALGVLAYRNHATIAGWCAHIPRGLQALALGLGFLAVVGLNMIFTKGWITELATVPLSVLSIHFVLGSSTTPRLLGLLGLMSYTLYVSHVASIALVAALLEQGGIAPPYLHPATWWVALPVALCVSAISYLAFEAPSRRALERLRSPGGPRPAR